jgi:hypothetical protein
MRPPHGWVKLNCDGSVKLEDNTVGTGMILRDEEGQVVFSACRNLIDCSDPLEAETMACHEGLIMASPQLYPGRAGMSWPGGYNCGEVSEPFIVYLSHFRD